MITKNRNVDEKLKFLRKIEIFTKNRNFYEKSKFWRKIEIFWRKILILGESRKFDEKSKSYHGFRDIRTNYFKLWQQVFVHSAGNVTFSSLRFCKSSSPAELKWNNENALWSGDRPLIFIWPDNFEIFPWIWSSSSTKMSSKFFCILKINL